MKSIKKIPIIGALAIIFAFAAIDQGVIAQDYVIFADNNNNECLEVEDDSQGNAVRVKVTECRDHHVQTFKIINKPGFSAGTSMVNIMTSRSRCLEIKNGQTSSGIELTQFQCDQSPEQAIRLSSGFQAGSSSAIFGPIMFTHSSSPILCFDKRSRPFIEQQPCDGSSDQFFRIMHKTQNTISLMDQAAFNKARANNTAAALNLYISRFPSGSFVASAQNQIQALGATTIPATTPGTTSISPEQQFWNLIENSKSVNDFRIYLANFPSGAHVAHANLRINQLTRSSSPAPSPTSSTTGTVTPADPALEQQFWDLVKDSKNVSDFQSYLANFPTGAHVAHANLQIGRLGGGSTPTIVTTTSPGGITDAQFLDGWANKLRAQMPITIKDIQLTNAIVLTSPNSLEIQGSTPSFSITQRVRDEQANDLKPFLLGQYCSSGAPQRNIGIVSRTFDAVRSSSHVYRIDPGDCAGNTGIVVPPTTTPGGSTITPSPIGTTAATADPVEEQFWNAVKNSRRVEDFQSYIDNFPTGKYVPLAKLEIGRNGGTVRSTGSTSTSGTTTTTTASNVEEQFWDAVKNSRSEQDYQRYISSFPNGKYVPLANLKISQIRAANGTTPPPANANTRTDAQILAAAQPGNLGELSTKRKFFVVSNDFNVKRNIADEIRKLVPQLTVALNENDADFFISYKSIDRTTGAEVANDAANPNLQGDMWVFTVIPASGNFPANIRLHRRIIKDRGFGVFSRTPDINSAKDLAKELQQVIR